MALIYRKLTVASGGSGTDSKEVKVSVDDVDAGFLEDKVLAGSNKVTITVNNPGAEEELLIDIDPSNIDHNALLNYDVNQHRELDDLSTTTTSLWSSDKIQTELDTKVNGISSSVDNRLVKTNGTSGVDLDITSITIDDTNNVTGINDLIIDGNLTVNGTRTEANTETLDVTDANITVNKNGSQATADLSTAGLTIEMSDATDAVIGYDSTLTSKFKIGEVGSEDEVVGVSFTQVLTNKEINADNNTISNLEVDNLKSGVLVTNLDNAVDNNNIAGAQSIKDYVLARVAEFDDATEITYTPLNPADWDRVPANVADALEELVDNQNAVEGSLNNHLDANPNKHTAEQINYTNTTSGLTATEVQAAIDELSSEKLDTTDFNNSFDTQFSNKTTDDLSEGVANLYFTNERAHISEEDIADTKEALSENVTNQNIVGLVFDNTKTRSFTAVISVQINATANLFESFTLEAVKVDAGWEMSISSVGQDSDVEFNITSIGQVQYSTPTYVGFTSGSISYRSETLEV